MDIVKPIKEIFKAYDIRGKFPDEINRDVAYTIGKAYGTKLLSIGKNKCIVGYDNRESSIELSLSLSLGILSTGVDVINLGLVTTPMAIYSKEVLKIPSYVMVTASHNPYYDNGIKVLDKGSKLDENLEKKLEDIIDNDCLSYPSLVGSLIKNIDVKKSALETIK